jgi:hypothetical protein
MNIYSIEPPAGWTARSSDSTDMNFDAPGGMQNGGMFVGLKDASQSVDAEMASFIGSSPVLDNRTVTIDGHSCRTAQVQTSSQLTNTMLMCHIVIPFSDGPANLEFFMGMASRAGDTSWHTPIFWQAANSLSWGGDFAAAP